jgi:tetratricopeptide (TPR) repeat protein
MFAFLHYENIRFEFLEKAVKNGAVQSRQQAEDRRRADEMKAVSKQQTWSMWSSDLLFTVLTYLYRNRGLPALPDVLRTGRRECHFDKFRVRAAMRQLTQCSLVIYNHEKDSYSMHPLVHKWAREAPEMTFGEQSIWAEAAGVLLSCCILLPPLGTSTKDEELRKDLLPHVDHVRDSQAQIEQSIRDKRMARMKPWPIFETGFNRERALVYAKFSVVYAQNGRWEDAKRLQLAVKEFTMKVLGLRHLTTRRIHLALAGTLLYLGESNEAALLQERVVAACEEFLGPDHRETLVAKESLGESRWLQGRLSDAKKLQEEAVAGLQKQHGLDDEDTLNAIDYLGRTVSKFYRDEDIQRARDLHQTAIDGMRRVHGSDRLRTLIACENLCCVAVLAGQTDQLLEAHEMMNSVLNIRKTKLGKEHGYTLHAMVNLALVKKGLGDLSGAEELILTGLPIAERNLGANHIAYLWGRHNLGLVWIQQERWDEAESLFFDVTERQKVLLQGRGRYHPDRVIGLVQLAAVYNALGKHKQRDAAAEEAMRMMDVICTEEHRVAKKLKADMEMWKRQRMTTSSDPAAT